LQAAVTAASVGEGGGLRARLGVVRHPHRAALGRPILLQPGDRLLEGQRGVLAAASAVRAGGRRRSGRLRRGGGQRHCALRHARSRAALQVRTPPAPGRVSAPACQLTVFSLPYESPLLHPLHPLSRRVCLFDQEGLCEQPEHPLFPACSAVASCALCHSGACLGRWLLLALRAGPTRLQMKRRHWPHSESLHSSPCSCRGRAAMAGTMAPLCKSLAYSMSVPYVQRQRQPLLTALCSLACCALRPT